MLVAASFLVKNEKKEQSVNKFAKNIFKALDFKKQS